MTEVIIAGIGQTPVGEHWDLSLRSLAARAIRAALRDAGDLQPQAVYIGNFLSSQIIHQANLGALITTNSGLEGLEAFTLEAANASGAAAFRMGYLAVASGYVDTAVVVGVEKVSDVAPQELEAYAAQAMDYDYEIMQGLTLSAQAALLMRRYMHEFDVPREAFAAYPMLAHANAAGNPNAYFRRPMKLESYQRAGVVADPLNLFDTAPLLAGAAAVVLTRSGSLPAGFPHPLVRVVGSSLVTDAISLHDRPDPLAFRAAALSVERACRQAGILPEDIDFFELSDNYSFYAPLSIEAAGFAKRGEGWKLAQSGAHARGGRLPLNTMGGAQGRGNPLAASGVYQIVEAVQQLRGQAGANQLARARRAMTQSLGGAAGTAVTHILERWQP